MNHLHQTPDCLLRFLKSGLHGRIACVQIKQVITIDPHSTSDHVMFEVCDTFHYMLAQTPRQALRTLNAPHLSIPQLRFAYVTLSDLEFRLSDDQKFLVLHAKSINYIGGEEDDKISSTLRDISSTREYIIVLFKLLVTNNIDPVLDPPSDQIDYLNHITDWPSILTSKDASKNNDAKATADSLILPEIDVPMVDQLSASSTISYADKKRHQDEIEVVPPITNTLSPVEPDHVVSKPLNSIQSNRSEILGSNDEQMFNPETLSSPPDSTSQDELKQDDISTPNEKIISPIHHSKTKKTLTNPTSESNIHLIKQKGDAPSKTTLTQHRQETNTLQPLKEPSISKQPPSSSSSSSSSSGHKKEAKIKNSRNQQDLHLSQNQNTELQKSQDQSNNTPFNQIKESFHSNDTTESGSTIQCYINSMNLDHQDQSLQVSHNMEHESMDQEDQDLIRKQPNIFENSNISQPSVLDSMLVTNLEDPLPIKPVNYSQTVELDSILLPQEDTNKKFISNLNESFPEELLPPPHREMTGLVIQDEKSSTKIHPPQHPIDHLPSDHLVSTSFMGNKHYEFLSCIMRQYPLLSNYNPHTQISQSKGS